MASNVNQHYVPQFYFRYFTSDEKSICLLHRKNGRTIKNASIKGQASRKYFYGDEAIEKKLSQIEGYFSTTLQNLRQNCSFINFDFEDYFLLLQNIMLQKSRTMTARIKSKAMNDRLLQMHLEMEIHNDTSLYENKKNEFLEYLPDIVSNPKQYQIVEMEIAVKLAEHLLDLIPVILINKTNRPLIFGDSPVIFFNPHLNKVKLWGVLGAKTPGLLIYYPISSSIAVFLFDKTRYLVKGYKDAAIKIKNLKDVAALNKLQIHNAASTIYFSDFHFSSYVEMLWKEERGNLRDHLGNVNETPSSDINGVPLGCIFHAFEPQLPFIPRLSFLTYTEIEESEYRFMTRVSHA